MFLLESVEGGAAARPLFDDRARPRPRSGAATAPSAEINRAPRARPRRASSPAPASRSTALRALLAESRIELPPGLPPMAAGVFGYLGYDMVRQMERLAPAKPDPIGVPEAMLIRPTVMVVFDSVRDEIVVVDAGAPARRASARAPPGRRREARLDAVVAALEGPLAHAAPAVDPTLDRRRAPMSNTSEAGVPRHGRARQGLHPRRRHLPGRAVAALHRAASTCRPSRSTARCGASIPSPFLCFLDFGGFQIVCSSPEILVRVRDGKVTIRPIAGTRWRGATPAEDAALGRRAARRPQGARRASDAARSRPQRRRPRRRRSARSR